MFWNDAITPVSKLLAGFVQIFFEKTFSLLKGSALVDNLVHAELLSFNNAWNRWSVQSGQPSTGFLPLEAAAEQQASSIDLAEMKESVCG